MKQLIIFILSFGMITVATEIKTAVGPINDQAKSANKLAHSIVYMKKLGVNAATVAKEVCSCLYVSKFIDLEKKEKNLAVKSCIQKDPVLSKSIGPLKPLVNDLKISIDPENKRVIINQFVVDSTIERHLSTPRKTFISWLEDDAFYGCQMCEVAVGTSTCL